MKKLFAGVLTLAMILSMSLTAMASELISITLAGEDYETGCFVPGKTYYLEAMDGKYQIDDDFFKYFKTKIDILGDGKRYITGAKFQKMRDGYYRLTFKVNPNYSYKDNVDIEMHILATDKKDSDNTYTTVLNFTVGYGGNPEFCSDEEMTIYARNPLVEFDEYLKGKTTKINFDDYGSYSFKVGTARMINFAHTIEPNTSVENANPSADLTFLDFYARPTFGTEGTLRIYAPDAKYLYKVASDNSLTRLIAPKDDDEFVIKTSSLDSYVASNIALKAVGTESTGGSTETTQLDDTTPDNTSNTGSGSGSGIKQNPATGTAA